MRGLILLLLAIGFLYPCSDAEVIAPSIAGGKGELIGIRIEAEPGSPEIFIRIEPLFGESVQSSIQSAYEVALARAGSACKVKVYVNTKGAVDGPSAGAAFALAFYSALAGIPLPKTYAITGTINDDSTIGPVGGIYEKATAAENAGLPLVTGRLSNAERFALMELGIDFIEVKNFSELVDLVINNTTPNRTLSNLVSDYPNIPCDQNEFYGAASMLIEKEELLIDELSVPEVRDFYREEVKRQRELLSKGYVLPAANEGFSGASTLYAIKNIKKDREEVEKEVDECLSSVSIHPLAESNFEANAFAIVRIYRAKEVLKELPKNEGDRISERVRLGNAYFWCLTAKHLLSKGEGRLLDESKVEVKREEAEDPFYALVIDRLLEDGHNLSAYYEVGYAKSNSTAVYRPPKNSFESKIANLYYSYSAYAYANGDLKEAALWLENAESAEKLYKEIKAGKDEQGSFWLVASVFGVFFILWALLFTLFLLGKTNP